MSQIFLRSSYLWPSSTLVPCTIPALTHCCCGHFWTSATDHCSCHRIVISTHKLLTSSPMLCMSCLWCWKLCIFIVKSMYKTLPLSAAVLMFTFIDNSCCGCWTRVVVHHYSFFVYLKTFTSPDRFCLCGACTLTAWLILIEETIDLWPCVGSGWCRISPPRFLAECRKRQLNQVSLVLLYFRLSAFSYLYWLCLSLFSCTVLFVSISQVIGCEYRLRNDLYCVGWGVKLYSNQTIDIWWV